MLKVTANTDIHLVAIMVAKLLNSEHQIDEAPALTDYEVREEGVRLNGSTDILVPIPIGRGIAIDVKQHWLAESDRDLKELTEVATEIAENIDSLHQMRQEIVDMTKEVRSAASREIAKARRRGLAYRLVSAEPYAAYDNVRDGVAVKVVFERLSEYLRPERAQFGADSVEEVIEAFESNREEQEGRMVRRHHLDAAGATGRIDSVVVNAMREAGHDVPEVLKLLATTDDWIVDIGDRDDEKRGFYCDERDGGRGTFRLHWSNGDVYAQITLGDGVSWHEGRLTFREAPVSFAKAKGRRVRDIVDNPIFGDLRVRSGGGKKGEYALLNCTQHLLHFDADTGRLWAA